jgi:hypothetical protein
MVRIWAWNIKTARNPSVSAKPKRLKWSSTPAISVFLMQKISILPSAVSGETQPVKQQKNGRFGSQNSTRRLNLPHGLNKQPGSYLPSGKHPNNLWKITIYG